MTQFTPVPGGPHSSGGAIYGCSPGSPAFHPRMSVSSHSWPRAEAGTPGISSASSWKPGDRKCPWGRGVLGLGFRKLKNCETDTSPPERGFKWNRSHSVVQANWAEPLWTHRKRNGPHGTHLTCISGNLALSITHGLPSPLPRASPETNED